MEKKTVVSIFIIAVMVLSTLGFVLDSPVSQTFEFNGYSFTQTSQGWRTEIEGNLVFFDYFPPDVSDIKVSSEAFSRLRNSKFFVVSYLPNSEFASYEAEVQFRMDKVMKQAGSKKLIRGLVNSTGFDVREYSCETATPQLPVVVFRYGNSTEIRLDNNCVVAEYESVNDLQRFADRLLYVVLGVLNE